MSEYHYGYWTAICLLFSILFVFGDEVKLGSYSFIKTRKRRIVWSAIFILLTAFFSFKGVG